MSLAHCLSTNLNYIKNFLNQITFFFSFRSNNIFDRRPFVLWETDKSQLDGGDFSIFSPNPNKEWCWWVRVHWKWVFTMNLAKSLWKSSPSFWTPFIHFLIMIGDVKSKYHFELVNEFWFGHVPSIGWDGMWSRNVSCYLWYLNSHFPSSSREIQDLLSISRIYIIRYLY